MSTVVNKQQTLQLVVGFDEAGCTHAEKSSSGILCQTLFGHGQNAHVNCNENAESCEAVWDSTMDSWVWFDPKEI